jgi:hypothetical protein
MGVNCAFYEAGQQFNNYCVQDGGCDTCPCACLEQCNAGDVCPYDSENDLDSDVLCGDDDSCPNDPENDIDSDATCFADDECPYDKENDPDSDVICGIMQFGPYCVRAEAEVCETFDIQLTNIFTQQECLDEALAANASFWEYAQGA